MNGINNISFGKADAGVKSTENKGKNHKRAAKIAVAAGATAVVVGGVLLYKNRKSEPVLKFKDFLKNGIFGPLKEKDVSIKEKVSNVWNNVKTGVKNIGNKSSNQKDSFIDTVEIRNDVNIAGADKKPSIFAEKPANELADMDNIIFENATQEIADDIAKKAKDETTTLLDNLSKAEEPASKIQKTEQACKIPEGSSGKAATVTHRKKTPVKRKASLHTGSGKTNKDATQKKNLLNTAQDQARNLKVAGATAAVTATGIFAGAEIGNAVCNDDKKKNFAITVDGEKFNGRLENGRAFDENNEPFSGTLDISFDSGKRSVVTYNKGLLMASAVFDKEDDEVPSSMREYDCNGKIIRKHTNLNQDAEKGKNVFKSNNVDNFSEDSMLRSKKRVLDEEGKHTIVDHFMDNRDAKGKIIGKPIFVISIETQKFEDGSTLSSAFIPYGENDTIKARSIKKQEDGSMEITIYNPKEDSQGFAQINTDSDKKIESYWCFTNGKGDDALFEIKDGKLVTDDFTRCAINADLMPDSTDSVKRYKMQDNSVVEFGIDDDQNIYSIMKYKEEGDELPECELVIKDGRAASEIFYDKDKGDVIFKLHHKL